MLKCGKCKFLYYVRTPMKYVTKSTDKLNIARFTSCIGLKYHKIRYKSRGNNPIKKFQFQFTYIQAVFLLVTSFIKTFWLLEMYLLKGAKSLSEEAETVFTVLCSLEG